MRLSVNRIYTLRPRAASRVARPPSPPQTSNHDVEIFSDYEKRVEADNKRIQAVPVYLVRYRQRKRQRQSPCFFVFFQIIQIKMGVREYFCVLGYRERPELLVFVFGRVKRRL